MGPATQFGAVDAERVRALEAAAEALPADDPRRAQVLALLAYELHHGGEPERCRALATEAIDIARAAGDPGCSPIRSRTPAQPHGGPTRWQVRQRVSDELAELVNAWTIRG